MVTPPARPNRARQDDDAADSIVTPFAKLQVAAAKRLEAAKRSHAKQAVEEPEREPKANKKAAQKKPAPKKGAQKADAKKSEKKKGAEEKGEKAAYKFTPYGEAKKAIAAAFLGHPNYTARATPRFEHSGPHRRKAVEEAWLKSKARKDILKDMPVSEQKKRRYI